MEATSGRIPENNAGENVRRILTEDFSLNFFKRPFQDY